MVCLLRCKHRVELLAGPEVVTYRDVAQYVFGRPGQWIIEFCVVLLEIAFCAGFLLVIKDNMASLSPNLSEVTLLLILTPGLIVLSWIRWLKDLWVVSVLGLLVYVVGVMGISYYDSIASYVADNNPPTAAMTNDLNFAGLPMFAGTVCYALEGINLILPVEHSMEKPANSYKVIVGGMSTYAALCLSFALVTVPVGFGECSIILDCLSPGVATTVVKTALSVALLMTFPVTMYPAVEILEEHLPPRLSENIWCIRGIRVACVLLTVTIAAVVKDFAVFTELVGGSLMTVVGFIFPPSMYIKLFYHEMKWYQLVGLIAIVVFGVSCAVFATQQAVDKL
eukprot:GFYU01004311.1.p1 GENE.GFYU01004311.1~~GFYU01004311.1.p1  ORF type:complete len:338 (+),score=68.35 GFYU01004311.1:1-1014(+)